MILKKEKKSLPAPPSSRTLPRPTSQFQNSILLLFFLFFLVAWMAGRLSCKESVMKRNTNQMIKCDACDLYGDWNENCTCTQNTTSISAFVQMVMWKWGLKESRISRVLAHMMADVILCSETASPCSSHLLLEGCAIWRLDYSTISCFECLSHRFIYFFYYWHRKRLPGSQIKRKSASLLWSPPRGISVLNLLLSLPELFFFSSWVWAAVRCCKSNAFD